MGKTIAVSFEAESIRVVSSHKKKGQVIIDDAFLLTEEQFDDYLHKERSKEFIVVSSFKNVYQDILSIPIVKKSYTKTVIESEITKNSSFKDFSYLSFHLLGQNKKEQQVYVYAVVNDELRELVNRFVSHGKVVKVVYADVFSLTSQVPLSEDPTLCVAETGMNKKLFLMKDGKVHFIREARSYDYGINDLDIQTMAMTINYCRQNIKIAPSSIMLMGKLCNNFYAGQGAALPMSCHIPSFQGPMLPKETALDFISPISALSAPKENTLLPLEYKRFFLSRTLYRCSTAFFICLSIVVLVLSGLTLKDIRGTEKKLAEAMKNNPDTKAILASYDESKEKFDRYTPLIQSLKKSSTLPDVSRFLLSLGEVNSTTIRIESIKMTIDGIIKGELKGVIHASRFVDMQSYYQRFIESLTAVKGLRVKDHGLALKSNLFYVNLEAR